MRDSKGRFIKAQPQPEIESPIKFYKDPNASTKYVAIDSEKLLEHILEQELPGGIKFTLRQVQGPKSRKRKGGKHIMRLQTNKSVQIGNDECFPELVIVNSYDRTSPFRVEMGIFRLVCTNGMIVKSKDFGGFRCRHMGDEARQAQEIVEKFIQHLPSIIATQNALVSTELSEEQAIEFAMKAAQLRWNREFSEEDAEKLLEVARPEDAGFSAWAVFNRVQEKLMTGGIKFEGAKRTARELKNVGRIFEINNQLFDLVSELVEN